jgi:hypothetical protein
MKAPGIHIRTLLAGFVAVACFISWSITNNSRSAEMRSDQKENDRTGESDDFLKPQLPSGMKNASNLLTLSYYLQSLTKENPDTNPDQTILCLQHTIHIIREKIDTAQTEKTRTIEELERARETLNEMLETYKKLTTKEP